MTKIVTSKYKVSRRLGMSLWGSAKDPVHKRNYAPGQHGQTAQKRTTVYGTQLLAKQKLKKYYNMMEKQFKNTCLKAKKQKGNTSENLIAMLERRLDAVVYRLNLAPTIFSARQLVSHKHIMVNGQVVNIASYAVRPNDVIELKSKEIPLCIASVQKMERTVPTYLTFDPKAMKGSYINDPLLSDVPYAVTMQPNFVIEFYSK